MGKYLVCILLCILQSLSVNGQMLVSNKTGVTVTSSSQHKSWSPNKTVDGIAETAPDVCNCCGATNKDVNPWYKVDLGEKYTIQRIRVLGRTDASHNLHKMEIQLGTTKLNGAVLQGVDTTSETNLRKLDYKLTSPQPARYITLILRDRTEYFVICELYVYAVCPGGKYGPGCVNTCGKCLSNEPCDGVAGACSVCTTGYQSPLCNDCIGGRYGSTCELCGQCTNNDVCDKSNGNCPNGCSAGYQGTTCKHVCTDGRYGNNCNEDCGHCKNNDTCNKRNGDCPNRCSAGYKGTTCKKVCTDGRYGNNCNEDCGHCKNNDTCNKVNGDCPNGCSAGYKETTCKKVCTDGRYGNNCNEDCGHCKNNDTCNKGNGDCPNGCSAGYKETTCKKVCTDGRYGNNCNEDCGHCKNNDTCNKGNGDCPNGCSAGYKETTCKKVCRNGRYGNNCYKDCGNCKTGDTCDKGNGDCPNGCSAGYKGTTCKEVCDSGTYGDNCGNKCGNCENNAACNNVHGECIACATGYLSPRCIECDDGRYGVHCNGTCGQCSNSDACDKSDASCPKGCSAGYQGVTCKEACSGGKYGPGCVNTCGKCLNNEPCDGVTGECSVCTTGYQSPLCNDCIDGYYGSTCELCGQCTNNDVCDKGNGNCPNGCSAGYQGTICKQECNPGEYGWNCSETCGKCDNNAACNNVDGVCVSCVNGYFYPLCKDCKNGRYGNDCSEDCGHCKNNDTCNKGNGDCPNGCLAGYKETTCNEVCNFGTYGMKCENICGKCENNETCDTVSGTCTACETGYLSPMCNDCIGGRYGPTCNEVCGNCNSSISCGTSNGYCPSGCSAGYQGNTCKKVCDSGTYGDKCENQCGYCKNDTACNNVHGDCIACVTGYFFPICKECDDGRYGVSCNGTCGQCNNSDACDKSDASCPNGCSAGYQGVTCKKECVDGTYGLGCQQKCGNCSNNKTCNKVDGSCVSCAEGYKGNTCVDACESGKFGVNCVEECGNCHNETTCKPDSGECELGCIQGYHPPECKALVSSPDESNMPVGPIVGAFAGVIVLAIVVVIVVLTLKRRSKERSSASSNIPLQDIQDNGLTDTPPVLKQPGASVQVKREKKSSLVKKQTQVSVQHQPSVPNEPEPETENVYYAFLSKKTDLRICQLWDYIKFKKQEDCVMFYQEYSLLADKLKHPYDVAMKPMHRGKNRYRGLYAYDHSRVPLVVEDKTEVEYINASFIDGYEKPHKFIASQGPIESMRDDFWRMVWQQKSNSIVMLTNLIENGTDKCILYWPPSDEKTVTYGKITITLKSENPTNDYVTRHMTISKEGEDSIRPVTQFHYRAWPDKSYPDSTWSLIKFWLTVEEETSKVTGNGPIVVHCSAGIGRTGTYIAIDNAYYQAKTEGTVRILDVVHSLREQRVKMVQTKDQYVYLHEAVCDALLFGTHFVWSSQFEDVYEYLSQKEKGSNITRLQRQFNIIVESIADKRSVRTTIEDSENEYSNIFIHKKPEHLTIDEYRPKSKSLVYVHEVGALILQNHEEKDAFIVCKSPTESRMTEFWSLVKEQNVKTIVSLADVPMTSSKRLLSLGLENNAVKEKFGLSLAEERKTSIFTERKINFKDSTDDFTISQFEYNKWASGDNVPKDPSSMAHFVEAVLDCQRRLKETEPVLIYCNNGTERCGVMCALLSEIYRMIRDGGHINIIETVKMMKERHDDIIANLGQYVFIHDVIRSRVQDNTYQNQ